MAAFYWIKLYDEILDDPKMGRLSDGAYRLCINLFLLASRQELRDGRLPDFDDIGWLLRLSSDKLQELWQELERAGIVCMKEGLPFVSNFSTRQEAVSDAERMRRYRERKRFEEMGQSDEGDTPELQDGNEPVTNRNADKEEDKEEDKEKKTPPSPAPPKRRKKEIEFDIPEKLNTPEFVQVFTQDWPAARQEQRKKLTQRAANMQLKELAKYNPAVAAAMVKQSIMNQWTGIFPLKDNSLLSKNGHSENGTHHALKNKEIKQVQGEF